MESKQNETFWRSYFWKKATRETWSARRESIEGGTRQGGAPTPPGRALHPRGPLVAPLTYFFHLYIPIYPKTIGEQNRSGVPPPQASVATKNQSGPCSGTLPERGSLTGGHLHHPGALHDEEGVVHPRGRWYVPVAMCLISLSRVLSRVPLWHNLYVSRSLGL